jgi:thiol:disulfide interchange protein DsbA
MLKRLIKTSLLTLLITCAPFVSAEEQATASGYEAISPAQPVKNPNKVEVIEFFWYGCPHCYSFEPVLDAWVKKLPKNVEFVRQPAVFNELWGKHAKAYFTAEALGVVDKVHADFFDAIQNKKESLETEEQLAKFFKAHGVDETQFHETYNSFLVDSKMRAAPMVAGRYGITGVPALIVNGKYKTNGTLAGSHEKMLEAVDKLIKQESH